jgi:hypothetical protein
MPHARSFVYTVIRRFGLWSYAPMERSIEQADDDTVGEGEPAVTTPPRPGPATGTVEWEPRIPTDREL